MKRFFLCALPLILILGGLLLVSSIFAQVPVPGPTPTPCPAVPPDPGWERTNSWNEYRCENSSCGGDALTRTLSQSCWEYYTRIYDPNTGCQTDWGGVESSGCNPVEYGQPSAANCSQYQQCNGSADWTRDTTNCECQGECYPAPTPNPLNAIPNPPFNIPNGGAYKLPINFAWDNLNSIIGPACQVAYYQVQIPGSGTVEPPPIIIPPPPPTRPPAPPPRPPSPPPATGWCSENTLRPYFGSINPNASRICYAESGGNPNAIASDRLGGYDVGLFQINTTAHPGFTVDYLRVPENNIREAVNISGGGTNWGAWSVAYTYTCLWNTYIPLLSIIRGCVPWHESQDPAPGVYNCQCIP